MQPTFRGFVGRAEKDGNFHNYLVVEEIPGTMHLYHSLDYYCEDHVLDEASGQ